MNAVIWDKQYKSLSTETLAVARGLENRLRRFYIQLFTLNEEEQKLRCFLFRSSF